jgi:hypothetical protein
MLRFNRFGTELWPATKGVAIEAGISYRTARRHIDHLVERKVLKEMYPSNALVRHGGSVKFRRSATYKLDPDALAPRVTYKEWRASQTPAKPFGPQRVSAPAPSPTPAEAPKPSQAAPVPDRPQKASQPKMTKRDCARFLAQLEEQSRGNTRVDYANGQGFYWLAPGDPNYRAPMKWAEAFAAVCERWRRQPEVVMEALKFWGYTLESGDDS